MKNKTTVKTKNVNDNQQDRDSSLQKSHLVRKPSVNPVYKELVEEGHEDFYNYLDWLGLAKSHHLLILTSSHHYYFEVEDLKNIKTVVNLNRLNNIKSIRDFLSGIYNVLPHKCYFIGSFTDNKKQNGFFSSKKATVRSDGEDFNPESDMGPWNSFLNMLYGIIDSKTNRYMTEKSVKSLIEETGLKILDITELNGQTYFCAQKDNPSVE
jgi:hypothetical protein